MVVIKGILLFSSSLAMAPPRNLENIVVHLPGNDGLSAAEWIERLRKASGVADLLVLDDESTIYLKIDGDAFDPGVLPGAGN